MDFNIAKMLYALANRNSGLCGVGGNAARGSFGQRSGQRSRYGLFKINQRAERKRSAKSKRRKHGVCR
ncbi:hypothetical protein KAR91_27690 [Candidatus Pacearchaeota archaeon]|nr:hypothetical protein [Candidatus Pacearchaeota archaeon]